MRCRVVLTNTQAKALGKVIRDTGMKQEEIIRRCIDEGLLRGVEIYAHGGRKNLSSASSKKRV